MNKRVTIEMPDEMHRLVLKYAADAGAEPDVYLRDIIEQRLEDAHFLKEVEERIQARARGESTTYSLEEVKRELGLGD